MLSRFIKRLYPDIFKYRNPQPGKEKQSRLEMEYSRLSAQVLKQRKILACLKRYSNDSELVCLKIVTDKSGDQFILRARESFFESYHLIGIEIFDPLSETDNKVAYLHVQIHHGIARIQDIISLREDRGIGAILIETLFSFIDHGNMLSQIAMSGNGCYTNIIRGTIGTMDWSNLSKLQYFYSKFGFEVLIDHDLKQGHISKVILVPMYLN